MDSAILEQNYRLGRAGAEVQRRFEAAHGGVVETDFARDGAIGFAITPYLAEEMKGYFNAENKADFTVSDASKGYSAPPLLKDVVDRLNQENVFYKSPSNVVRVALEEYIGFVYLSLSKQLSYNFRVVNARAWEAKPGGDFGPSGWHFDGSHQFFLPKLMLYLNPPGLENGTIEFFSRDGRRLLLSAPQPMSILLDSSSLLHRGRPSSANLRPMIELTLAPDLQGSTDINFAGQNARFPIAHLDHLEAALESSQSNAEAPAGKLANKAEAVSHLRCADIAVAAAPDEFKPLVCNSARSINIGGGPTFEHPGWINLDEFPAAGHPPTILSDGRPLPVPSSTAQLVYSSHCLEHLSIEAVRKCLSEARRVLRAEGDLVIKIPDYDAVLKAYRDKDVTFFNNNWGLERISHLWLNRGLADNIEYRTSMIFCGFWNSAYGHEFGGARTSTPAVLQNGWAIATLAFKWLGIPLTDPTAPYHGPAPLSIALTRDILAERSPARIASSLREFVLAKEKDFRFNHQTAFSRDEFGDILAECGFELLPSEDDELISEFSEIPGIEAMRDISAYFHCRPA